MLTLVLALWWPWSARAAEPTPPISAGTDAGLPSATAPSEGEAPFRFRVVVEAPRPLPDVLNASLGLVRWQSYADMTEDLFDQLAREAIDEAHEAASTEGFFSATVDVRVDRATTPATVTVVVTPGDPTRIHAVDVEVTGPAATQSPAAVSRVRDEWRLPLGAIFRQAAWDEAKQRAVATLAAERYAAARLAQSEANIDPDAKAADLSLVIDSGPAFRVGTLQIEGTRRYDADLVRRYSTLRRGDPYALADLDQYVRRLSATGYFASVHAVIDTDPAHADDAPVTVSVIEAPPKRIEAGIGFSTDTRVRANLNYRDVDFLQRALQFTADLRLESKVQSASFRVVRPPNANGWSIAGTTQVERTDIEGLITETASIGARGISLDERNQWEVGPAFLGDVQRPSGGDRIASHALYGDVQRTWRRVDDLAAPSRGFIAQVDVGASVPGVSTRAFGRVVARFAAWHPIDRENDLSTRLEAGAVIAASRDGIPSTLLFRTGGDQSVRGYAYQSLGVQQGDAVLPGRYYGLASVEATHWIREALGIAAFVDAGDAFDDHSSRRVAIGYGVGGRVRTPIGPFRLDVAYGQLTRQVRIHFSVGLAF
ncbi:MAG TPA: BamA/TamA family outer membrane protein [Casimicrobiaceae bacterium]|nr:BamA/TamA family outer membrane protein [Casimicrobiaceae bacterium]